MEKDRLIWVEGKFSGKWQRQLDCKEKEESPIDAILRAKVKCRPEKQPQQIER